MGLVDYFGFWDGHVTGFSSVKTETDFLVSMSCILSYSVVYFNSFGIKD